VARRARGFERCLVGVGSFLFEPVSWILSAVG
jgi:hypothetical protein